MGRYKVPQNLDMEDRIIGNLSMSQFGYLVIGGLLAYGAYMKLPAPLNLIIATPIGLFAAASGLLKINNQPFPKFFLSFITFLITPEQRVWHRDDTPAPDSLIKAETKKVDDKTVVRKKLSPAEIQKLAQIADSHGFSEIDKQ